MDNGKLFNYTLVITKCYGHFPSLPFDEVFNDYAGSTSLNDLCLKLLHKCHAASLVQQELSPSPAVIVANSSTITISAAVINSS